jgi:hypothetical protein
VDGENLMCEIKAANKAKADDLAHGTYMHIKITLSAMFAFAKRKDIYDGVNPMTGVTIPKGKSTGGNALPVPLRRWKSTLSFSLARSLLSSPPRTVRIFPKLLRVSCGRPSEWRHLLACVRARFEDNGGKTTMGRSSTSDLVEDSS